MNGIRRLVYLEIIPTILIALVVLTFISFSSELRKIGELLYSPGMTPWIFLRVISVALVNVLPISIPVALLVGLVTAFSRLSADSEAVALLSCGVAPVRLLPPVLIVGGVGLVVGLWLTTIAGPLANRHLREVQLELTFSNLAIGIQPRVFHDDFPGHLLYVADVEPNTNWRGVFLIRHDQTDRQIVFVARRGVLQLDSQRRVVRLLLEDGVQHTAAPGDPAADSLARFARLELPLPIGQMSPTGLLRRNTEEKFMEELWLDIVAEAAPPDKRLNWEMKYYNRIAMPFACLAFAVIGLPLGLGTRRGGRGGAFVVALVVVAAYYAVFLYSWKSGAYQGFLPVSIGVWVANALTFLVGAVMLWRSGRQRRASAFLGLSAPARWVRPTVARPRRLPTSRPLRRPTPLRNPTRFRLLDIYIGRLFLGFLLLIATGSLALFTIFRLFEMLDGVFSRQVPARLVAEYFLLSWPMITVLILPTCLLVSFLVLFGNLERARQVTALKACGVSVYRAVLPVMAIGLTLAGASFMLQEYVLPVTNPRFEALHRLIVHGQPLRTYERGGNRWLIADGDRIIYLGGVDRTTGELLGVTVFDTDLEAGRLQARESAHRAIWLPDQQLWRLTNGWRRELFTGAGLTHYPQRDRDLGGGPALFHTELKSADKMDVFELTEHIERLSRAGFHTAALEVDLHRKLAHPAGNLVVLLIGLPFALRPNRGGTLYGLAVSLLVGLAYASLQGVFSGLGAQGGIPPSLAAWAPNLVFGGAGLSLSLWLRS